MGNSPLKSWTKALVRRLENQILSLDPEYVALHIWRDENTQNLQTNYAVRLPGLAF